MKQRYNAKRRGKFRRRIWERDDYACVWCGVGIHLRARRAREPLNGREPTVDHVLPSARGGRYVPQNLVTCCHSCNRRRGATYAVEFAWTLAGSLKGQIKILTRVALACLRPLPTTRAAIVASQGARANLPACPPSALPSG